MTLGLEVVDLGLARACCDSALRGQLAGSLLRLALHSIKQRHSYSRPSRGVEVERHVDNHETLKLINSCSVQTGVVVFESALWTSSLDDLVDAQVHALAEALDSGANRLARFQIHLRFAGVTNAASGTE